MKKTILSLLILLTFVGCKTSSHLAVKTVSLAGSVATKTTVAVIKTSGQVVASTAKTVVQTSGNVVSSIAKSGFVIFKDTATGVSKQIPYTEGLKLYAASKTAQFDMGLKAFELLRNGTPVMKSQWSKVKEGTYNDPKLHAGDVVQVTRVVGNPKTGKNVRKI